MAKLKRNLTPAPIPAVSAEPLAAHEGEPPDPSDGEARARWLRIRAARWSREVGGPADPRWLLMAVK